MNPIFDAAIAALDKLHDDCNAFGGTSVDLRNAISGMADLLRSVRLDAVHADSLLRLASFAVREAAEQSSAYGSAVWHPSDHAFVDDGGNMRLTDVADTLRFLATTEPVR